jgi:hypothetical protein
MFAQSDDRDKSWKENITCHKCGKKGHLARECKSKGDEEKRDQIHANVNNNNDEEEQEENLFAQYSKGKKGVANENYLLLNNQSTINQVANPSLLTNIRRGEKPIVVHCNAGSMKTDLIGELGSMTVHHNPKSIANVLSLKSVASRHHVTYDSKD